MGTEHDDDVGDPADEAERLEVFGPPAEIPDVHAPDYCPTGHRYTRTFADGEVVCRDCGQTVDWVRG